MTPESITLVRESWRTIQPRGSEVAEHFYERLFELDPTIAALLAAADIEQRRRDFVATLTWVVTSLDAPELLVPAVAALGRRHASHAVSERSYDAVGEALLWTLSRAQGAEFSEGVRRAWAEGCTLVACVIKRASGHNGKCKTVDGRL